ncbi:MAG: MBL fold metallo-hydrolase, partial [Chitinophagaceae bacterium]|nr:MBL fold metallo-hydrolase [Chitinophagaceae bacterium]
MIKKEYFFHYIAGVLLLANLFVWYGVWAEERGNILKVVFLDIGQGDSIFIEAPNGNQVLIDGGPNKKILEKLGEVMPIYDKTIDIVIATHPDSDHIGGLPEVLEKYSVGKIFEPNSSSTSETYQAFENIISKKHLEKVIAERGQEIILDENPEIKLEILSPETGVKFKDTNESSIVAKLIYASSTFLFTGDLQKN